MRSCHHALSQCSIVAAATALAACAPEPAEEGETAPPQESVAAIVELPSPERHAFEARAAGPGDFVINFGEPFLQFESRGNLLRLHDFTGSQQVVSWIKAERSGAESEPVFSGVATAPTGENYAFTIEIEARPCDDEFSGEVTDHVAWYGNPGFPRRVRGCARVVGTPQRWPEGWGPP